MISSSQLLDHRIDNFAMIISTLVVQISNLTKFKFTLHSLGGRYIPILYWSWFFCFFCCFWKKSTVLRVGERPHLKVSSACHLLGWYLYDFYLGVQNPRKSKAKMQFEGVWEGISYWSNGRVDNVVVVVCLAPPHPCWLVSNVRDPVKPSS